MSLDITVSENHHKASCICTVSYSWELMIWYIKLVLVKYRQHSLHLSVTEQHRDGLTGGW